MYDNYYYNFKCLTGCEYKNSKIIATYKNGEKLNDNINIEDMKNGIFFDNDTDRDTCTGFAKEYIYNELIFEGEYINNCRIKGKEYENSKLIFEGEFRNNNKWKGKFKKYENKNLILDGEYRYGNKKYYIYIPFYRNKKNYIIYDKKINKYKEIEFSASNNSIIREIPIYDYNIDNLKSQIEKDKLINSFNKNERNIEFFEYKYNYYIIYEKYENLQELINKYKSKLPNDIIYRVILQMKNIFEFCENSKIFYDFTSENIVYEEPSNIKIYLDFGLYINKSNYYYKMYKLIKSEDNKYNYKDPELNNDIKIDNLSKVNIWSLGILIFQMIFHEFPEINYQQKLNKDNLLHNLIIKILTIPPEKRISLNELNNDALIKQINILYDRNIKCDRVIRFMLHGISAVGNNSLANSFALNSSYLGELAIIGVNKTEKLIYYNGLKI